MDHTVAGIEHHTENNAAAGNDLAGNLEKEAAGGTLKEHIAVEVPAGKDATGIRLCIIHIFIDGTILLAEPTLNAIRSDMGIKEPLGAGLHGDALLGTKGCADAASTALLKIGYLLNGHFSSELIELPFARWNG